MFVCQQNFKLENDSGKAVENRKRVCKVDNDMKKSSKQDLTTAYLRRLLKDYLLVSVSLSWT